MKKTLKILLVMAVLIGGLIFLTACDDKKEEKSKTKEDAVSSESTDTLDWATLNDEEKVEHAIHQLLKGNYGDKLLSAKIYVDKIYTKEEIEANEVLKSLNIKDTDIAFEVSMYLEPAEGADINQFTVPDGEYDEDTGWVSEIYRLGILRYNAADKSYSIDNYGTGW